MIKEYLLEEGEKIGKEKGEKIGKEKGEKKGVLKVARNMLAKDLDMTLILDVTGLDKDALAELDHQEES